MDVAKGVSNEVFPNEEYALQPLKDVKNVYLSLLLVSSVIYMYFSARE